MASRPELQYFARNDGITMAYRVFAGDSRRVPLVMVTGLSAIGTSDWGPDFDIAFAKTRPILVMDNRMVGSSTAKQEKIEETYNFGLNDLTDDVIKLVEHVGWQEIDLLGFSMGGMIAQLLVLRPSLPFRVRKLVLTATSAKNPRSDLLKQMRQPSKPKKEMTEAELDETVRPFVETSYSPAFLADPKNEKLFKERLRGSWADRRPLRTILTQAQSIMQYNVVQQLPSIPKSMPVLIIHGTDDKAVYFSERDRLLQGIKHAEVARLPEEAYGHFWYDYFTIDIWVTLLSDWLDRDAKL